MHFVYINWLQLTEGYGMLYLHVDIIRSPIGARYCTQGHHPPLMTRSPTSGRRTENTSIHFTIQLIHRHLSIALVPLTYEVYHRTVQNCLKKNDPYNYINMFQLEKKFSQCYPKPDVIQIREVLIYVSMSSVSHLSKTLIILQRYTY